MTPREPEIEFLGKMARAMLLVLRVVLWVAGLAAIVWGVWQTTPDISALGAVWIAVGLPLACPADSMFTRGIARRVLLGTSVILWFAPIALADDSQYGFILRMFATLIAFVSIFVWRTLWRLTPSDAASTPRSPENRE